MNKINNLSILLFQKSKEEKKDILDRKDSFNNNFLEIHGIQQKCCIPLILRRRIDFKKKLLEIRNKFCLSNRRINSNSNFLKISSQSCTHRNNVLVNDCSDQLKYLQENTNNGKSCSFFNDCNLLKDNFNSKLISAPKVKIIVRKKINLFNSKQYNNIHNRAFSNMGEPKNQSFRNESNRSSNNYKEINHYKTNFDLKDILLNNNVDFEQDLESKEHESTQYKFKIKSNKIETLNNLTNSKINTICAKHCYSTKNDKLKTGVNFISPKVDYSFENNEFTCKKYCNKSLQISPLFKNIIKKS